MNEGKEERSTDWLEGWNESIATPAYVFDLDELKDRLQMIRRCLGNRIRLCYAMKANPFLVAPLQNFVDKYEVCSPGEFRICERHQVPMEQIVLSGVYKEDREICHAVEMYAGKGTFTIESKQQLELVVHAVAAAFAVLAEYLYSHCLSSLNDYSCLPGLKCKLVAEVGVCNSYQPLRTDVQRLVAQVSNTVFGDYVLHICSRGSDHTA